MSPPRPSPTTMLDPERLRRADCLLGALYSHAISEFSRGGRRLRRVSRGALLLWCTGALVTIGILSALVAARGDSVRPSEAPQEAWQRIASRIERPIRGRLSFGSRYRACPAAAVGCGPLPSPSSPEFIAASRLLARLAKEASLDPQALHAEALARMTVRGTQSNEVLSRLEAAAALAPTDSRIAADLLAVRLARAEDERSFNGAPGEGVRQVLRALPEAVRIAGSAAREPAAWFNYALVFEAVGLPRTASHGWRRFLQLEPEGQWADEARRRLVAAEAQPSEAPEPPADAENLAAWADENPLAARTHLERDLLARWAADPADADSVRSLALAEQVAMVTARRFGDATVAQTIAQLRDAPAERRRRLGAAFQSYFAGLEAYAEQRFTDALEAFLDARAGMEGFPYRSWADYRVAVSLFRLDRFAEAGALMQALRCDPDSQQVLESRRLWLLGLVEGRLGRLRESVVLTERAQGIVIHHPDLPAVASLHANLAAPLEQLAQYDRAWFHRLAALRASAHLNDHRLRHIALHEMATLLIDLGEPESALPFLEEMRSNAIAWKSIADGPLAHLEIALLHASALSTARRHEEAAEQIRVAVEAAGELQDSNRVERLGADISVERAVVLLAEQPARALEELDLALEVFQRFDYRYPLVRVHRLRGAAAEHLGLIGVAGEAYRAAVATHEDVLARLEEPDHRAGYLSHASDAYEALLRHLAVEEQDVDGAFDVLERSRNVWSATGAGEPQALRDIQSRLSAGSALVAFRVLENETLIWWIRRNERELLVLPAGRRLLAEEVTRHEAELMLSTVSLGPDSATGRLYERLFVPLRGRLQNVRRLTILPDRLLNRVAFAAVLDAGSGARLDPYESLSLLPAARLPSGGSSDSGLAIVSVGNPAFDRAAFPFLEPLPAAAREAEEVAALYPGSVALLGEEARAGTIRQELRGRGALHYAGHALFDPLHPERSGLLLAPDREEDGILTISDLEDLSIAGLDLVVLSACRTSGGDRSASQDWAEALLNAGVRGVVAARWEVEDESARRFLRRFHQLRTGGMSDGAALLATQREFRSEPPRMWAAFSYYGTH